MRPRKMLRLCLRWRLCLRLGLRAHAVVGQHPYSTSWTATLSSWRFPLLEAGRREAVVVGVWFEKVWGKLERR